MKQTFRRSESNPGAVLNTDDTGLAAYKAQKARNRRLDTLESDVGQIKAMLTALLEKMK